MLQALICRAAVEVKLIHMPKVWQLRGACDVWQGWSYCKPIDNEVSGLHDFIHTEDSYNALMTASGLYFAALGTQTLPLLAIAVEAVQRDGTI